MVLLAMTSRCVSRLEADGRYPDLTRGIVRHMNRACLSYRSDLAMTSRRSILMFSRNGFRLC